MRLKLIDFLRFKKISHVEERDTDCKILFVFYTNGRIEKYCKVDEWCELRPHLRSVSNGVSKKLGILHQTAKDNQGYFILDHSYYDSPMRKRQNINPEWTKETIIHIIKN